MRTHCQWCGQRLDANGICPDCAAEANGLKILRCPKCGTTVSENYVFCTECGAKLPVQATSPAATNATPTPPTDPSVLAAGVLCFLVSVSLLGLALFQLALTSSGHGDLLFYAFLNVAVGAAYIAFGIGLIMRAAWAQDWAYWSSWLNGVLGGLQVLNGAWLFIPAVALSFVIVGLLHRPYHRSSRINLRGVWITIAALVSIIILFVVIWHAPPPAPQGLEQNEPISRELPPEQLATLSEFQQLHDGMTYQQACEIIGSQGTVISESSSGGYHIVMYQWEGQGQLGANMNAMFQNDQLVQKAQFGLE